MDIWLFRIALMFSVLIFGIILFALGRKNERSSAGGVIFVSIIAGVLLFGSWVEVMNEMVKGESYQTGYKAGLEWGFYSGVPETEMKKGSFYLVLTCIDGEDLVVLQNPNAQIGLFRIQCRDPWGRDLLPKRFYRYETMNSGGLGLTLIQ